MFRNLRKEKELVDREMKLYYEEKKNEIDQRMITFETKCATDTAALEHDYHSKQEEHGIAIAKLEATKELLENDTNTHVMLLAEKDKEIERMNNIVIAISKNVGVNVVK